MTSQTAWIYLLIAGVLEIIWASAFKSTQGFSKIGPSLFVLFFMAVSFYCLAQAIKILPMGTAYAVWTGIGAAGTVLCGIAIFGEPASFMRIICIAMIIFGIVGLKINP